MRTLLTLLAVGLLSASAVGVVGNTTDAESPGNEHFERTWSRTDKPVADGNSSRTWMWGPGANTLALQEEYAESPGNHRVVQYYDKSRMEITDPAGDASSVWFVTNGLLVVELMTGAMQVGDSQFSPRLPADIPVAGDSDDTSGPTYRSVGGLRGAPPLPDNAAVIQRVDRNGSVTEDPSLASRHVTAAYRIQVPGIDHQVASPFWAFMNSSGTVYEGGVLLNGPLFQSPFYATGYPLTEAYWANVKVGGTYKDVLLQCFERRCLTYTPDNPPGWQVEAGNVGLHYYTWRYPDDGDPPETATPESTTTAEGTASPTGTETPGPTATTADPTKTATTSPTATTTPAETVTITPSPTATPELGRSGRVFVSDLVSDRIQVFDIDGQFIFAFGETGQNLGQFDRPWGIDIDRRNRWVYVADFGNDRIQKFDLDGNFLEAWGSHGSGPGQFAGVVGVDVAPDGTLYVLDYGARVQHFESDGTYLDEWGESGSGDGQFLAPTDIATTDVPRILVVDRQNGRIQKFKPNGDFVTKWSNLTTAPLNDPWGIAVDADRTVYMTDYGNNRVVKYDTDGTYLGHWGSGLSLPAGIDVDPWVSTAGVTVVYVVNSGEDRIDAFDGDSHVRLFSFGRAGTADGQFESPSGIAVYRPWLQPGPPIP